MYKSVLKEVLSKEFPIEITSKHIRAIVNFRTSWEHKNRHYAALNSPLLGVEKARFIDSDQTLFFEIFNIDKSHFGFIYRNSLQSSILKEIHELTPFENDDDRFKVMRDPYNGLSVYVAYLIANSGLSTETIKEGIDNIFLLLNYKFFTSIVTRSFKFPASEPVMKYTIENLSAMYTIKQAETSTWKALMMDKAVSIYVPNSLHYNTIRLFNDDAKIVYAISDTQTKIAKHLRNIIRKYYDDYEADNRIINSSMVNQIEGKKVVQAINSSYQNTINNVVGDAININKFIDNHLIDLVVNLNKKLRTPDIKKMLMVFSNMSAEQYKANKGDLITVQGEDVLYIGYKALLDAIVQKSFRMCVIEGVNMSSGKDILIKIRNAFTSSKIDNKDIENIKTSLTKFFIDNRVVSNEAFIPALRITFVIYIMLLAFKHI